MTHAKTPTRNAVAEPGSFVSMQAHSAIQSATQPELDSLTNMQHNAVGGKYRPDVAVRLILQLEEARRSILTACDALHRALHRASDRAQHAQLDADNH